MNDAMMKEQIEDISTMGQKDLREKFETLFGFPAGQTSVPNLRSRIIYKFQEIYLGGIRPEDIAVLEKIAAEDDLANLNRKPQNRISKVIGTKYERLWKGQKYEVTVMGDGQYEYGGDVYQSLSAIARKITWTRWNGKLFFGVK